MSSKFKKRVADAVEIVIEEQALCKPRSNALYTPMKVNKHWEWSKFSVPDGLLLNELVVGKGGNVAQPEHHPIVIAAVLVQCEETTSLDLLNPWGKASIFQLPGGVWVDVETTMDADSKKKNRTRAMVTFGQVLFIAPTPSSTRSKDQKTFKRRNIALTRVQNASIDATVLDVTLGISAANLAPDIWKAVKQYLT